MRTGHAFAVKEVAWAAAGLRDTFKVSARVLRIPSKAWYADVHPDVLAKQGRAHVTAQSTARTRSRKLEDNRHLRVGRLGIPDLIAILLPRIANRSHTNAVRKRLGQSRFT